MNQEKLTFICENAPCYLYEKRQIIERCRFLRSVMPEELFLYSIKANPFRPVVEAIAEEGLGADAASAREVLLAEQAGIPGGAIFYFCRSLREDLRSDFCLWQGQQICYNGPIWS